METELLAALQGSKPNRQQLEALINGLEAEARIDLADEHQQQQLEGVWELRWSSSNQPYLQVQPWLENLQVLMPSQGRGMNLLRPLPPLAAAGVAVEAELSLDPPKRVQCGLPRRSTGASTGWLARQCDDGHPAKLPGLARYHRSSAMSCAFAAGKTARCSPCASAMILMLLP